MLKYTKPLQRYIVALEAQVQALRKECKALRELNRSLARELVATAKVQKGEAS